jgi:hypothetical protein
MEPRRSTGTPNTFPSRPPSSTASFAGSEPFGSTASIGLVDTHLRTPHVYQYNLNMQQQLPGGMVLETGYVCYDAHKLTSLVDVNPFPLGSNTRLYNPDSTNSLFSNLLEFKNVGVANYNALQVGVTRRYTSTKAGNVSTLLLIPGLTNSTMCLAPGSGTTRCLIMTSIISGLPGIPTFGS